MKVLKLKYTLTELSLVQPGMRKRNTKAQFVELAFDCDLFISPRKKRRV